MNFRPLVAAASCLGHPLRTRFMSTTCKRLVGKTALVTGSTAGIGYAIAKRLGEEGAHVVVASRKQANVDRTVKELSELGISAEGVACHVGNAEDRQRLIDTAVSKNGGLDILVNNVGTNPHYGRMIDTPESAWDKIFDNNVKATFLMTQLAYPYLKESKNGPSVTIISSIAGYDSLHGLGAYSTSKTALHGMVLHLAKELGRDGIRVNGVAPGIVKTVFSDALTSDEKLVKAFLRTVPLGKVAVPEQIAGTVAYLASEDASYVSGENIVVAGGLRSRL
eukprot:CFRG7857T1